MRAERFMGILWSACTPLLAVMLVPASAHGLPGVAQDEPGEARVTIELLDTDVRDALRLVAKQAEVDLVVSNEVSGSVTLELTDASLRQTLDAIVNVSGLQYSITGRIVTVTTLKEQLERDKQRDEYASSQEVAVSIPLEVLIINLRYVDADRVLSAVEGLLGEGGSISQLKTSDHIAQDNQNAGSTGSQSSDSPGLQIGTQLTTSSVGQPARSHTLVISDVPERLELIAGVIAEIDVKPVQVLIEARFVEVRLGDEYRLGIDWNVVAGANGAASPHTFPFGDSSLGDYNPNVEGGSPGGVFPPAPPLVSTPSVAGLFTFGTLDFSSLSAVLDMLQEDTSMEIVSSPHVVVGDRHTATILVGERYPILSANISEFGNVTEQLDHYEPIGVQLEVTPSVLNDDEVELYVRPSTSSLGELVTGSTGLSVARINARQIDTSVTVKDSQTLVLAGLITTRERNGQTSVPFLGAIPLLGKLFTHKTTSEERVDLVVFLTVKIVQELGLTKEQQRLFELFSVGSEVDLEQALERSPLDYDRSALQY